MHPLCGSDGINSTPNHTLWGDWRYSLSSRTESENSPHNFSVCPETALQRLVSSLRALCACKEAAWESPHVQVEHLISFKGNIDVIAVSASVRRGLQSVVCRDRCTLSIQRARHAYNQALRCPQIRAAGVTCIQ